MPTSPAKNTTVNTAESIRNRFYVETFLTTATPKLRYKQLGQLNIQMPKGTGGFGTGLVYWTKFLNLPLVTAGQGEGVPTTAVQMTAANVTGSTAQLDAAVSVSDLLVFTSFGDIMKIAMERLGENAGKSIDTSVREAISEAFTVQRATTAAHITAIPATGVLSITEIRKAVRTLRRNDAPEADGGGYMGVAHPDTLYDIMADTSTGGWIDANRYNSDRTNLFTGEVGKLLGVRWLESTNAKVSATSSVTGTASLYVTNIFGKEAFGVTNMQNLQTYVKGFGSGGTSDPTEKVATAGWKCTFGTSVLNSAFGVSIYHTVTSTA